MARFKHTDNSQGLFMAINLKEQLLPGTFEWAIDYLIDKADMLLFEKTIITMKEGRSLSAQAVAEDNPALLSRGIITSRRIEKACHDSITAKALTQDIEPDHDTIAAFISTNKEAVEDLFSQILPQCAQLGLITGEIFAIDGCKLPSNTSKKWSGTIKKLRKKRGKLKEYYR
jgi:transposase